VKYVTNVRNLRETSEMQEITVRPGAPADGVCSD
jgi:hypothetical protein